MKITITSEGIDPQEISEALPMGGAPLSAPEHYARLATLACEGALRLLEQVKKAPGASDPGVAERRLCQAFDALLEVCSDLRGD